MPNPDEFSAPDQLPPDPHHRAANSDPWGDDPEAQLERQRLAQEAARHTKARHVTFLDRFTSAVLYLVAALEVLLGLRFLLRLTAANPENTFAAVIYRLSEPFIRPFSTLFISPTFNGSLNIFDLNILVAMAAYLALLALFLGLLRVLFGRS